MAEAVSERQEGSGHEGRNLPLVAFLPPRAAEDGAGTPLGEPIA